MSRPTTRSKNKKQKSGDSVDTTGEVLRKIHISGEVTQDDIGTLYRIWKPVCQGCRVNTKDNPNCFCGLIPPPNGSRKTGLWQKTSEIVQALGPDPASDLRESTKSPAGLTNLGATCYANSILQCLYMNKSFREGIFSAEPGLLEQHAVLDQLARLFAQLNASKRAYIDSSPFVKTLDLDNGVQQDSHEFLTLLLSLLERCLGNSKVSKARTIVQDLFRGSVSNVTTCSQCGKDSEASSNMEDFYELELNVKGLKSLNDSLDDYLSMEELHGDNQYFCESCKTRVNASRSIKLRSLPRVLNFHLKRCVFVPKTTTKKKITSLFSFPEELDMRQRICEPAEVESIYDLSAVLIHKGTAVNSGHYVAHVKDENTGQWWEFDDESVSDLGRHPFGGSSSNSNSKPAKTEPALNPPSAEQTSPVANGHHKETTHEESHEPTSGHDAEIFSSTEAYMLMYNLRSSKKDSSESSVVCSGVDQKEKGEMISLEDGVSLPFHLFEEVNVRNTSDVDACRLFKSKKETELDCISERRQEVRSVLSDAPVTSLKEPFYWISADWLRQWADNVTVSALDNTSIACLHGKVPISKVISMKRLSAKAWDALYSKYKGGPKFLGEDICTVCLFDGARTLVCADGYRGRRMSMKQIAEDVLAGRSEDGTYFVSKAWLQQWLKRKILDAPSEADAGPTGPIKCPHGELMPEQASGAKRLLVPENLWLFLYKDATAVNPGYPVGCSTFPSDSRQCSLCSDELSEVACMEDSLRVVRFNQRQKHEKLASGKSFPLSLDCYYYLVPSSWLLIWRNYINASGRNVASAERPETLDGVIDSLKCEKHSLLMERPPDLVWRRGSIFQKLPATDVLVVVTENDWNCFCEEWGGTKGKGISARVELSNPSVISVDSLPEEIPRTDEDVVILDDVDDETETRLPQIRTSVEICEDCVGEKESLKLVQKLNYSNEDIYVYLIRGKEAPKSILQAPETNSDPDRRVSKRSRKTNSGNQISLKVSGSTTVYQLKMMIWESFGVVKENQMLHKGTRTIDSECASLADMNIFPGDKLWVTDSEIHEHRDIADELSNEKMDVQHSEGGFHGTLLTANTS